MQNPFYGYGRIRRGGEFVGRHREVKRLTDYLASCSGNLGVIGEHRVGKSSLVRAVQDRVIASNGNPAFAWINLAVVPDSVLAFQEMVTELIQSFQDRQLKLPEVLKHLSDTNPSNGYEAYQRCRRALIGLRKAGIDSLVVMDEFDAVRSFEDSSAFIQRLRELIDHRDITGLSMVFISRRSLIAIERQLAGVSNLDGVCQKHFVKPLDAAGVEEMLGRCGDAWQVSQEDKALLLWYTGGHPYLAEMILCHGWDDRSVVAGFDASLSEILDHYRRLRNLLEEDKLFDQLVQATVGPHWSLRLEDVERLVQYGIMRRIPVPEGGHRFQAWSGHFQEFLEKCAREKPVWDLWRETETGLRDLIESVYTEKSGQNWQSILRKRHEKSLGEMFSKCESAMAKEQKNFGLSASDRLLDYTYPMDLWTMISVEWQHFRDILDRDKKYWGERFSLLAKIRTPIAHSRESIPEHDLTAAQSYCQELLACINEWHKNR
uniref:AAA ATPase domain-containing protein n=1 Tax=Candidatus Kentrum sp. MB TaxID=2138164 RepID=A0A450XNL8_9GAMM|nr:MAG: AAA ATPase domain-containing protein [Candidatus Kentron sp. MB]